jgi:hypothetical protein
LQCQKKMCYSNNVLFLIGTRAGNLLINKKLDKEEIA